MGGVLWPRGALARRLRGLCCHTITTSHQCTPHDHTPQYQLYPLSPVSQCTTDATTLHDFNHRNISARHLRTFSTFVCWISISFSRSMSNTWFVLKEYWVVSLSLSLSFYQVALFSGQRILGVWLRGILAVGGITRAEVVNRPVNYSQPPHLRVCFCTLAFSFVYLHLFKTTRWLFHICVSATTSQ